jgi:O-methyltransferase involved in polyketide biosynthesis
MSARAEEKRGDLSVTALYTCETWGWGGLAGAELLVSPESRRVFDATNAALAVARPFQRDPRSLKHSLLHRHAILDHLLRASGARRVLELAAGLSRRGAAFSADPSIDYTEVDLAPVLEKKRALLDRTEAGRAVLARPNLHFMARDVTEEPLDDLVTPGEPLFVIAEGLLVYLAPEGQRALFGKARSLLRRAGSGTLAFDLVPACEEPAPGAAGRALGWMMKRFTGGKAFERDERTREDLADELRDAGFDHVDLHDPAAVAGAFALPFPDVPTRQLVFAARAPVSA